MATYIWPLIGQYTISSNFGMRSGTMHKGMDIAAPEGTPIIASRAGTVTRAEYSSSYGNVVYIDHGDGYSTRYAHMVELPMVRKGQVVEQGQQIGKVGNTGNSFGNHLHFEVRYNDSNAYDPKNYISKDNNITAPTGAPTGNTTLLNSSNSSYTAGTIPYTPKYIMGVRSIDMTHQPMHAFLNIWIGDKLLTTDPAKPNYIQSFEMTRLDGAGNTASFTIFDDEWEDVELQFSQNWDNVYIQYGYVGGVVSPKYKMQLTTYTIDCNFTGTFVHVSAISQVAIDNLKTITLRGANDDSDASARYALEHGFIGNYENENYENSIVRDFKNPTDVVKAICAKLGYTIKSENFDETESIDIEFSVNLENPISYIKDTVIQYARTPDGNELTFWVDDNKVAYFKSIEFGKPTVEGSDVPTYIYQKGYDTVVQSISFDIKGVFGGTSNLGTTTEFELEMVDPNSKELIKTKENARTVMNEKRLTGQHTHTKSDQSSEKYMMGGETGKMAKLRLYYRIKNATSSQYEAMMTILGDPEIQFLSDIRVVNLTDKGYLHHTSGIYKVSGITDSIDSGVYTTKLKLIRNGDINEGVEVVNGPVVE